MRHSTALKFLWATLTLFAPTALIWAGGAGGGGVTQGNDPPNRVVFLHYDYMVAPDHSHAPDPQAIQMVVEAFRRHGVTLHIDPIHNAIAERLVVTTPFWSAPACAGPDAVTLNELRATYFQPKGNHTWHYAVFAHDAVCPDSAHCFNCPAEPSGGRPAAGSTGLSEVGGLNFAVTFGSYFDAMQQIGIEALTGTFMHELGHNFGLRHGGSDDVNQKPNFISIMNYSYQLSGIRVGDAPGSTNYRTCITQAECGPPTVATGACATRNACHCTDDLIPSLGANICFRTDYSDQELPALNEFPFAGVGGLDENVGVSGSPGDTDLVSYWVPGPSLFLGPSYGPINWNNVGGLTEHVQADINNDTLFNILTGFNDWAHVQEFLNTPEYRNGVVRQNPAVMSCGPRR